MVGAGLAVCVQYTQCRSGLRNVLTAVELLFCSSYVCCPLVYGTILGNFI